MGKDGERDGEESDLLLLLLLPLVTTFEPRADEARRGGMRHGGMRMRMRRMGVVSPTATWAMTRNQVVRIQTCCFCCCLWRRHTSQGGGEDEEGVRLKGGDGVVVGLLERDLIWECCSQDGLHV